MGKSGISELSIAVAIGGVLEGLQQALLQSPIIPPPWGGLVLGAIGVGIFFARRAQKTTEAEK